MPATVEEEGGRICAVCGCYEEEHGGEGEDGSEQCTGCNECSGFEEESDEQ